MVTKVTFPLMARAIWRCRLQALQDIWIWSLGVRTIDGGTRTPKPERQTCPMPWSSPANAPELRLLVS